MQIARRTLVLIASSILFWGCAATVHKDESANASLAKASDAAKSRIVMSLTRVNTEQPVEDWTAFREEWQTSMTAAAQQAGATFTLLDEKTTASKDSGVLLRVKVNDFRYVSQAKRYAVGVLTGNASLDVDVQFIETPAGTLLGTRKYTSSSSALNGIFAAMTPKQVEATANEIVGEITRK